MPHCRGDPSDWEELARAVLDASFLATLLVGGCLAVQRKKRVKVFLTSIGGGVFGNETDWIAESIDKALAALKHLPLDVKHVHFSYIEPRYTLIKAKTM